MRTLILTSFIFAFSFSFAQLEGPCNKMPAKNKKIVAFLKTKVGKMIGEADLIYSSYKYAGIKHNDNWLGNSIHQELDCIYPGDLIVFKSCNVKWKLKDTTVVMSYGCHVEYLIYKVKSKGVYQIIVQLEDESGKVTATLLDYSKENFINGEKPRFIRPNGY